MTTIEPHVFPSLDPAEIMAKQYKKPLLVQQEVQKYTDNNNKERITRRYLLFPTANDYIQIRQAYPHCHEVMLPYKDRLYQGRLVFDFDLAFSDMEDGTFPDCFQQNVEDAIKFVLSKHYKKYPKKLQFVWLDCRNRYKISKHLIVRGVYFVEDWVSQLAVFYNHLRGEFKNRTEFTFFKGELIDLNIARNRSSLRMPGNSKLDGEMLRFEKYPVPNFQDGLIDVYFDPDLSFETLYKIADQIVSEEDMYSNAFANIVSALHQQNHPFNLNRIFRIFERYSTLPIGTFKLGPMKNSGFIQLLRKKSSKCLVNIHATHDKENAYMMIVNDKIMFGCHRQCVKESSLKNFGSLTSGISKSTKWKNNTPTKGSHTVHVCDIYSPQELFSFLQPLISDDKTLLRVYGVMNPPTRVEYINYERYKNKVINHYGEQGKLWINQFESNCDKN